jgi:hypothetical protein
VSFGSLYSCVSCSFVHTKQSSPATRHGGAWRVEEYSSYSFLTSALDGGEWSASSPGRALPRGKDLRYPLDRRLIRPQNRYGHRGKILCHCRGSNLDRSVLQSSRHYTAWATWPLFLHTLIQTPRLLTHWLDDWSSVPCRIKENPHFGKMSKPAVTLLL